MQKILSLQLKKTEGWAWQVNHGYTQEHPVKEVDVVSSEQIALEGAEMDEMWSFVHDRRLIYTINAIEGFNCQLQKVTKSKSIFPTDDSLLKMLYLAMMDITKKWMERRQDWSMIHNQLTI